MIDEQRNRAMAMMEELKRHFGVLGDKIDAQVAESRKTNSRLDTLEARFDELTFGVRELKTEVGKLGGKVDKLEGKVDKLEGKVDKLEAFASEAGPRLVRLEAFADDAGPRLVRLEAFADDAGPRLVRIETHLALPALPPRQDKARLAPSKTPHRRKPLKRN